MNMTMQNKYFDPLRLTKTMFVRKFDTLTLKIRPGTLNLWIYI